MLPATRRDRSTTRMPSSGAAGVRFECDARDHCVLSWMRYSVVPDAGGPQGLKRESRPSGQARGQGCCPRNCARRAWTRSAQAPTCHCRKARRRNRPSTREPGDRPASRLRARTGGVYRCSGGKPAGGLSILECRIPPCAVRIPCVDPCALLRTRPVLTRRSPADPPRRRPGAALQPCRRPPNASSPPPAFPRRAIDIPAGVTVIDRQTIETARLQHAGRRALRGPGLRVSQSGGPGGNASVFVRGTNSNQVLVLRDGMPINDASDSDGAFNFGVDTLADVERIEVIRGPMAALYGSGAIGGVINLITRQRHEQACTVTGDLVRRLSGADRAAASCASGIEGPLDYALILRIAVAARLRHDAAARVDLHRRAAGLSRPACHAEPRLHAGAGHAAVAAAARARVGVRLQRPRRSHLRRLNSTGTDDYAARPHRRHVEAVRRHLRDQRCSWGAIAGRPAVH